MYSDDKMGVIKSYFNIFNFNILHIFLEPQRLPMDCYDVQKQTIKAPSGVYVIKPDYQGEPFEVYCDMDTDQGGWTVSNMIENIFQFPKIEILHEWREKYNKIGEILRYFELIP